MAGFRVSKRRRDQAQLFPSMLDDAIALDHPVRAFAEAFESAPFQATFKRMSRRYNLHEGKPPYHPKVLAALWVYGVCCKFRSSRELEDACHNRIDFRWLMEEETPDHSTICEFVKRHNRDLKALLCASLDVGRGSGLLTSRCIAVDGTKVEANASRHSMKSRVAIKRRIVSPAAEAEYTMNEWDAAEVRDEGEPALISVPPSAEEAPAAARVREAYRAALKALERREQEHAASGARNEPNPLVSTTDPDARLMKDKEGRCKPNYTPQIGVDSDSGMITADDVTDAPWDGGGLLPMIEQTEANTGVKPQIVSADSAYNTGAALQKLEEKEIVAYMPDSGKTHPSSPARNAALDAARSGGPLTSAQIELIKDNRTHRLSGEAFRYDAERDVCVCPAGQVLKRGGTVSDRNVSGVALRVQYKSDRRACAPCALRSMCLQENVHARTHSRDQHEGLRAALRARMATAEGRREYAKRTVTERAWSWLKLRAGLRKFLRRGFAGVRAELTLACIALNMRILIADMMGRQAPARA